MTDNDLATLLRSHVDASAPPFDLDPQRSIRAGRRTVRRRRTVAAVGGLSAAAVVAAGIAWVAGGSSPEEKRIDPATAAALAKYDASAMPGLLRDRVGQVVSPDLPGLGAGTFNAVDSQMQDLPQKYWDKASSMSLTYATSGHEVSVYLSHSRSEAEGSARRICAAEVDSGTALRCDVSIGPDDSVITTRVYAVVPTHEIKGEYAVVARDSLESGTLPEWLGGTPLDRSELRFQRTVKVVHSETFVTSAQEVVRDPSLAAADKDWAVPLEDLVTIATDPELVIPEPPIGEGGCPWTLPGTGVTCGVEAPSLDKG